MNQLPDAYELTRACRSCYDIDSNHATYRKPPMQASIDYNSCPYAKPVFQSLLRDNKEEPHQHVPLTRDYPRNEFSTNSMNNEYSTAGKDRAPNLAALRALTSAAHYNSCWAFSSMPEIPMMQSDDEFLVDTGIRIPAQLSASQSTSRIPYLQDFVTAKRPRPSSTLVRFRRSRELNYERTKFKRHSSVEYEDCMKRRTNENDSSRSVQKSIDYEEGLQQRSMLKENLSDQPLSAKIQDARIKRYSAPHGRTRFGWDTSQEKSLDEKLKRNSLILDKDRMKLTNAKSTFDRNKRHSTSFTLKLPDTKETGKQTVKRHSLEDHITARRTIKGYFSTLDVNHNQGLSKIPLRNVGPRSRTAPTTRASSPVRVEARPRFDIENCDDSEYSASGRHLSRYSSSDEEVDKLCRMLLHSQPAQSNAGGTPRSRERYPIHLMMKKL